MTSSLPSTEQCVAERSLCERVAPRLQVEKWFAESGRTYRRGRVELWYKRRVEPQILKFGLKAAGLYARGVRNAETPVLRRLRLGFPNLPVGFEGFQVLHLSDFHIDGNEGLAERIGALLAGVRVDLCVWTGDYRFDIQGPCDEVYDPMRKVVASISSKQGVLGILGNHDAAEIAHGLEEMGVRMLVNESVEIFSRGDSLWVAGIDDPFDYRCDDLRRASADIPSHAFKILLAHTPDRYREAGEAGFDLYLCGHTHAGQIRLPIIGSVKHNSKTPRLYSYGLWREKQMRGFTTAGIGCSALPVRYNCPPEAVLIELGRESTT